jgi:hypothetical protein
VRSTVLESSLVFEELGYFLEAARTVQESPQ